MEMLLSKAPCTKQSEMLMAFEKGKISESYILTERDLTPITLFDLAKKIDQVYRKNQNLFYQS
jgi:hypothetical protein